MNNRAHQSISFAALFSASLIWGAFGNAQEVAEPPPESSFDLSIGRGQTDNLNRDAVGLRSDRSILGLEFNGRRVGRTVQGAVSGDLEYLKYGAEGLADDSEVLGAVDGLLDFRIVPERFHWDVRYGYGQTRTDPRAAVGPTNRERTTVMSTGPELILPLGERNLLELGAQIADRSYGITETLDSRFTTARLSLARSISAVTRVALNLERSETEFKISSDSYQFDIVSLEYRKELASGEAIVSAGRGNVEIGGVSEPTAVARLAWNRAVGSRSRLEICAGRELTDAGGVFAGAGSAVACQGELSGLADASRTANGRLLGVVLSTSPLVRGSAQIRFVVDGTLADFDVSVARAQDRFRTDSAFDNDATIVGLTASRQLGQRWRGEVSVQSWDQNFIEVAADTRDQTSRFVLSRSLARASRVELVVEHNRRVSDVDPFDENAFTVYFGHEFAR